MMHATLSTLIMYYGERFEAQEMHLVLSSMRDAYRPIHATVCCCMLYAAV